MNRYLKIFTLLFLFSTTTFAKVYKEPFPLSVLPETEEMTTEVLLPQADSLNLKINTDYTTQLQNEEQVALNLKDSNNYVAVWRDFRLGYRQIGKGYTTNGGKTWRDALLDLYPYTYYSDPGITYDTSGNFYAVVLGYYTSDIPNGLFITKSTNRGITFGPTVPVVDGDPTGFEDKELMACDRTNNPTNGNLYVSWTRFYFAGGTKILLARSINQGVSFLPPVEVSDNYSVQWSVPAVGAQGEVYVAWFSYSDQAIKIDKSTDAGATFGTDITVQSVSMWSENINGGILVFPFPAIDVDIFGGPYNGYIYIAYMDRRDSEDADIYFTRSTDEGQNWSTPKRINDDPIANGADQFHPWIAIDQSGTINVAFYDRRNDPSNLLFDLYLTHSTDAGESWSKNRRVTTVSSNPNFGRAGLIGEYIGLVSNQGCVIPVWTDIRNHNQDVYTANFLCWDYTCGDVNNNGIIDIEDMVYLINYVFYQGPEPYLWLSGDVNYDFVVDIGDIVVLINYVFYQGTPPCE